MARAGWNGQRVTDAIRRTVARDRGTCAYCEHPGANSLDHIIPAAERPDLEWDPSNWKAVHLRGAGTKQGCAEQGCACPGNVARGRMTFAAVVAYVRAATCSCPCDCGAREPFDQPTHGSAPASHSRRW